MGVYFCFFKQKTAYEMRISDWSSDVCSSDLLPGDVLRRHVAGHEDHLRQRPLARGPVAHALVAAHETLEREFVEHAAYLGMAARRFADLGDCRFRGVARQKIGRASCRERVCQYV